MDSSSIILTLPGENKVQNSLYSNLRLYLYAMYVIFRTLLIILITSGHEKNFTTI
jgi:hypothetical protein